jgi:hypothetical protein
MLRARNVSRVNLPRHFAQARARETALDAEP